MVGGAHLFVEELLDVAESVGVEALVLALILAPLATELPEKVNSFFWVREGKDALALGNITGAMVFQSTIPVGIGLVFTDWELSGNARPLDRPRLRRRPARLLGAAARRPFQLPAVIAWLALYAAFMSSWSRSGPLPAARPGPSSTRSSCFFGWTFGKTVAMVPSASIMKVARCTPQYFLPYIDFSPQAP